MLHLQFGQLRNSLTEVAANGQLAPELAESWEASPDAKSWHFKMRKGVEFHNGKSLTSAKTWSPRSTITWAKIRSPPPKASWPVLVSVKADGKHAVTIDLSGGDADFPFLMTDYHLNMCPANKRWHYRLGSPG